MTAFIDLADILDHLDLDPDGGPTDEQLTDYASRACDLLDLFLGAQMTRTVATVAAGDVPGWVSLTSPTALELLNLSARYRGCVAARDTVLCRIGGMRVGADSFEVELGDTPTGTVDAGTLVAGYAATAAAVEGDVRSMALELVAAWHAGAATVGTVPAGVAAWLRARSAAGGVA